MRRESALGAASCRQTCTPDLACLRRGEGTVAGAPAWRTEGRSQEGGEAGRGKHTPRAGATEGGGEPAGGRGLDSGPCRGWEPRRTKIARAGGSGGRAGVRGRGARHRARGIRGASGGAPSPHRGGAVSPSGRGKGVPPRSRSAQRRHSDRVPRGGEGVSEAGRGRGRRQVLRIPRPERGGLLGSRKGHRDEGRREGRGAGPSGGRGWAPGGRRRRRRKAGGGEGGDRGAGVRLRGAQDLGGGGRGRSRRSSHSPQGGRRRRMSRSPYSGWGAAAVGVQGPECGPRVAGPLGAGGSGGRVEPRRTREGSPRPEVMGGSACRVPDSVLPGRWPQGRAELAMQFPRLARRERLESRCGGRRRRRAGTRPAPRPDAQFGSCLGREGGRAARAVGKCSLRATGRRRRGGGRRVL